MRRLTNKDDSLREKAQVSDRRKLFKAGDVMWGKVLCCRGWGLLMRLV